MHKHWLKVGKISANKEDNPFLQTNLHKFTCFIPQQPLTRLPWFCFFCSKSHPCALNQKSHSYKILAISWATSHKHMGF